MRARIRSLDLYSGHADGTELVDWIKARLPLRHDLFLVLGEETAIDALAASADERSRDVLIRRLQRALENDDAEPQAIRHQKR